jgi:hypothetical protein
MTGRGAGLCSGNHLPGFKSAGGIPFGGSGRMNGSFGCHRGFRHWFNATGRPGWMRFSDALFSSEDDEIQILKLQAEYLSNSLDAVKRRICEMKKKNEVAE